MKNHCVISHGPYEVEKLTVPDSGFCVKKMKEKSVTFCFLQLKAKKKKQISLKSTEEGDLSEDNLGLFFQS